MPPKGTKGNPQHDHWGITSPPQLTSRSAEDSIYDAAVRLPGAAKPLGDYLPSRAESQVLDSLWLSGRCPTLERPR